MFKRIAQSQTALIRVDFNVPVKNGKIIDFTRINAAEKTIRYFLDNGFRVVLMSHLGRPKDRDIDYTLELLIDSLKKIFKTNVIFSPNIIENDKLYQALSQGEILLLENLRFYDGEANNDPSFSKLLSNYGDIYVNDAFGVSHRDHASISGIHQFFKEKKYKGFLLEKELSALNQLKQSPKHPYTVLIGGSKIGSKIHILRTFLNVADNILIGGGMAFPFIKYLGGEIGNSLCSNEELKVVQDFLLKSSSTKTNVVLPTDCVITEEINQKKNLSVCKINKIPKMYMGVDIGPETIRDFSNLIESSGSIMWNGPMGVAEIDEFSYGTKSLAKTIAFCTSRGLYSLIGGGDTVSDMSRFGLKNQFSYVSTGGGAMLAFFKNPDLIGAKNLKSLDKI